MSVDHSGHRQRLKRAYRENGLLSFSPHEVVELMLYEALPRRDVNELAHKITDALGGVSGLLKADREKLAALGLSENVAETLLAYARCVKAYRESLKSPGKYILNRGDMDAWIKSASDGKAMLTLLSAGREVICSCPLPGGDIVPFVCEKALIYDAGEALVSPDAGGETDKNTLSRLEEALKLIDVRLIYA